MVATDSSELPIVIFGGGLTGLACAARMSAAGRSIVVIANPPALVQANALLAPPILALSEASVVTLTKAGAWGKIEASGRCLYYEAMHVWDGESSGQLSFRAFELGAQRLGCTVASAQVYDALAQALSARPNVSFRSPENKLLAVRDSLCGPAVVVFGDGEELSAALVVGADGKNSRLRELLDIPCELADYQQTAIVFMARSSQEHENACWQCFQEGGVIAFLPTTKPDIGCVVWSCPTTVGEECMALDRRELVGEFNRFYASKLPLAEVLTEPLAFPLRGLMARRFVNGHCALAGDAGRVVHPLAGQGGNLALADVDDLSAIVESCDRAVIGSFWINRYQRLAEERNKVMGAAINGIRRIFSAQHLVPLRKLGMDIANCKPLLRAFFKAAGGTIESF